MIKVRSGFELLASPFGKKLWLVVLRLYLDETCPVPNPPTYCSLQCSSHCPRLPPFESLFVPKPFLIIVIFFQNQIPHPPHKMVAWQNHIKLHYNFPVSKLKFNYLTKIFLHKSWLLEYLMFLVWLRALFSCSSLEIFDIVGHIEQYNGVLKHDLGYFLWYLLGRGLSLWQGGGLMSQNCPGRWSLAGSLPPLVSIIIVIACWYFEYQKLYWYWSWRAFTTCRHIHHTWNLSNILHK